MHIDSRGIIFRQVKTTDMRRMLLIFTEKYGKLSVGTSLPEKNQKHASLALRPFTCGNYSIYKGRNYYNLDRVETLKSFYGIGEDLDKYMAASLALELTEKIVPEEVPQPRIFALLLDFLNEMELRKQKYTTLLLAFETKLLFALGTFPRLDSCASCGSKENPEFFSVPDGGVICRRCFEDHNATKAFGTGSALSGTSKVPGTGSVVSDTSKVPGTGPAVSGTLKVSSEKPADNKTLKSTDDERLIFKLNFDIVKVLNYFASNSLKNFRNITLQQDVESELQDMMRSYISFHMDVGKLKSDKMLNDRI
mgnify:FL=1